MLTLYGDSLWDSPWVLTVFVALKEKSLDFESRALDLSAGEQLNPTYHDASLTGRVPSIDHDGFVLSESAAIVEYLEEVFPAPEYPRLLPESVRGRARARQIMGWLRSDLLPLREARPTSSIFFAPVSAPLSDKARASAEKLFGVCERLIPDHGGPIFGDVSVPDFELTLALQRLIANGDAVPSRLLKYAQGVWQRPSVQAFVAQERPKIH
jgi:glutathione S-transferase